MGCAFSFAELPAFFDKTYRAFGVLPGTMPSVKEIVDWVNSQLCSCSPTVDNTGVCAACGRPHHLEDHPDLAAILGVPREFHTRMAAEGTAATGSTAELDDALAVGLKAKLAMQNSGLDTFWFNVLYARRCYSLSLPTTWESINASSASADTATSRLRAALAPSNK